jgi:hypothetical protein
LALPGQKSEVLPPAPAGANIIVMQYLRRFASKAGYAVGSRGLYEVWRVIDNFISRSNKAVRGNRHCGCSSLCALCKAFQPEFPTGPTGMLWRADTPARGEGDEFLCVFMATPTDSFLHSIPTKAQPYGRTLSDAPPRLYKPGSNIDTSRARDRLLTRVGLNVQKLP